MSVFLKEQKRSQQPLRLWWHVKKVFCGKSQTRPPSWKWWQAGNAESSHAGLMKELLLFGHKWMNTDTDHWDISLQRLLMPECTSTQASSFCKWSGESLDSIFACDSPDVQRMTEQEEEAAWTNVCGGGEKKPNSVIFLWYVSCQWEKKAVFIRGISGSGYGHFMSDFYWRGRISSHAFLLLSFQRAHVCSNPIAMTSHYAWCQGSRPWVLQHENENKKVGFARPYGAFTHNTDVWGSRATHVLCFPLYLCFVLPVINC